MGGGSSLSALILILVDTNIHKLLQSTVNNIQKDKKIYQLENLTDPS